MPPRRHIADAARRRARLAMAEKVPMKPSHFAAVDCPREPRATSFQPEKAPFQPEKRALPCSVVCATIMHQTVTRSAPSLTHPMHARTRRQTNTQKQSRQQSERKTVHAAAIGHTSSPLAGARTPPPPPPPPAHLTSSSAASAAQHPAVHSAPCAPHRAPPSRPPWPPRALAASRRTRSHPGGHGAPRHSW